MKIIIVGAGIGGLAAAISLHEAGVRDVEVYERSATIRGLGVGINLLPHALRELTELGVADSIVELGVAPTTLSYFNRHGQPIWSEPRGLSAGYRWPQLSVHRGRLQLALRDLAEARLDAPIRLGHRLIGVTSNPGGTETARFETSAGEVDVTADMIIGADGIHSALRALRYPAEGAPPWGGLTLWRGVTRIPAFLDGRTMIMAGDAEQKFVAYPLSEADTDGRLLVNFIAERRTGSTADADWNRAVDPAPIAEMFHDWSFDWLDVPAAIAAAEEILEYPMVDRDALPQWTFGRTTLLGDAAHAMYPNGSNGGSQAILDARTLAFHLATATSVDEALAGYESARRPAMTSLLERTRATGPERVMQLAYERAPHGFADIDGVIPLREREQIAADYKKAAGFLPTTLNERPTLTPAVMTPPQGREDERAGVAEAGKPVDLDAARLAAVISPLRRALLTATRTAANLPEVHDSHVDIIRALPHGTAKWPADIAAQLRLSRSTVSNLLGAMESAGLVERSPDPSDGRRVVVRASARALDLFARFDAASARIITSASAELGADERAALADALPVLERLHAVLAMRDAPASRTPDESQETAS